MTPKRRSTQPSMTPVTEHRFMTPSVTPTFSSAWAGLPYAGHVSSLLRSVKHHEDCGNAEMAKHCRDKLAEMECAYCKSKLPEHAADGSCPAPEGS